MTIKSDTLKQDPDNKSSTQKKSSRNSSWRKKAHECSGLSDEKFDMKKTIPSRKKAPAPTPESLLGKCLVHIGDNDNELYKHSVIYITECTSELVRGVMVNKLLFGSASLELKTKDDHLALNSVYEDLYQGGPVNPAHGVVIFPTEDDTADDPYADVLGEVSVSSSFGVLQGIIDGEGPTRKIIAMGHCQWKRGELEWQLFNNQWLIVPCSLKLLFDTKFDDRWELAKKESGVYNGAYIIPQIGLA